MEYGRFVVETTGVHALPHASGYPFRKYSVKANAASSLTITAAAGEAPEIDAAGGSLTLGGVGDAFPYAEFISDGQSWWICQAA